MALYATAIGYTSNGKRAMKTGFAGDYKFPLKVKISHHNTIHGKALVEVATNRLHSPSKVEWADHFIYQKKL